MADLGAGIVDALRRWGAIGPRTRVLVYDALADEPDVFAAASDGVPLLTRTPAEGGLTVHRADGELERHDLGFRQPVAGAAQVAVEDIDLVLVPGLVFDAEGGRIGRGAAYFDGLLPGLRPGVPVVGVVPSACVVERVPTEPHDVSVTHLATEKGVVPVGSVSVMDPELLQRARAWIDGDPDPSTRAELEAVVASGDDAELADRMAGVLEFGTAGIRGAVGAGSNRMNRAVVIRTTRGVADFLADAGRSHGTVVVGFDGRLSSRRFAHDTVGVLAAAGIDVRYFPEPVPTPLVAHAALRLGAVAAVVVTASHNPAADNGYKVYDSNGAQIVPPVDERIAAAIDAVGPAAGVPRLPLEDTAAVALGDVAVADYVEEVLALRARAPRRPDLGIVYTPMHGVGRSVLSRVFRAAGYRSLSVVPEQADPDGTFPTVAFPNPEEPGALDLASALADDVGADLAIANDPDADRLAVVVREGGTARLLSGNQIGVLLADFVLEHDVGGGALVVNSIVSSPLLADVARDHGARFEQTLTGFKWIANAAMDLERDEGLRFVFGYEEALGYTVGPTVRDKDGISAALWFADLAAASLEAGTGVLGRLEGLYRKHGLWASIQKSIVRPGSTGLAEIAGAMELLRERVPERLGSHEVAGVTDYRDGAADRPRWLPATALVVFDLGEAGRALVRPSGTEPKLKIYVDRRAPIAAGADVWQVEADATADGMAIAEDLAAFLGLA